MEKILQIPAKLVLLVVITLLIAVISPCFRTYAQKSQESKISNPDQWIYENGTTWHNELNLTVSKYIMEFDPNLNGVNFDTSLLRSDDLSTIYSAIKEKIVWKYEKRLIGIPSYKTGPWETETRTVMNDEVLPLRFCEESLIRFICDFKVTHLTFRYNKIDPQSTQLADSSITLTILANANVIDRLKSELEKQDYVKFIGRHGESNDGYFESSTPPRNDIQH